jgi:RNase adaptor protein for sRNA GlmZ degradation
LGGLILHARDGKPESVASQGSADGLPSKRSRTRQQGHLLIVSGMSGAGKTLTLQTLEDIGYFCVDNLPPSLLKTLVKRERGGVSASPPSSTAVPTNHSSELRSKPFQQLRRQRVPIELLFLDCTDEVLIRRFKETRRPSPTCTATSFRSPQAIARERELLAPLREQWRIGCWIPRMFRPQDLRGAIRSLYREVGAHQLRCAYDSSPSAINTAFLPMPT